MDISRWFLVVSTTMVYYCCGYVIAQSVICNRFARIVVSTTMVYYCCGYVIAQSVICNRFARILPSQCEYISQ